VDEAGWGLIPKEDGIQVIRQIFGSGNNVTPSHLSGDSLVSHVIATVVQRIINDFQ
jgi:hypothetical protein